MVIVEERIFHGGQCQNKADPDAGADIAGSGKEATAGSGIDATGPACGVKQQRAVIRSKTFRRGHVAVPTLPENPVDVVCTRDVFGVRDAVVLFFRGHAVIVGGATCQKS